MSENNGRMKRLDKDWDAEGRRRFNPSKFKNRTDPRPTAIDARKNRIICSEPKSAYEYRSESPVMKSKPLLYKVFTPSDRTKEKHHSPNFSRPSVLPLTPYPNLPTSLPVGHGQIFSAPIQPLLTPNPHVGEFTYPSPAPGPTPEYSGIPAPGPTPEYHESFNLVPVPVGPLSYPISTSQDGLNQYQYATGPNPMLNPYGDYSFNPNQNGFSFDPSIPPPIFGCPTTSSGYLPSGPTYSGYPPNFTGYTEYPSYPMYSSYPLDTGVGMNLAPDYAEPQPYIHPQASSQLYPLLPPRQEPDGTAGESGDSGVGSSNPGSEYLSPSTTPILGSDTRQPSRSNSRSRLSPILNNLRISSPGPSSDTGASSAPGPTGSEDIITIEKSPLTPVQRHRRDRNPPVSGNRTRSNPRQPDSLTSVGYGAQRGRVGPGRGATPDIVKSTEDKFQRRPRVQEGNGDRTPKNINIVGSDRTGPGPSGASGSGHTGAVKSGLAGAVGSAESVGPDSGPTGAELTSSAETPPTGVVRIGPAGDAGAGFPAPFYPSSTLPIQPYQISPYPPYQSWGPDPSLAVQNSIGVPYNPYMQCVTTDQYFVGPQYESPVFVPSEQYNTQQFVNPQYDIQPYNTQMFNNQLYSNQQYNNQQYNTQMYDNQLYNTIQYGMPQYSEPQ